MYLAMWWIPSDKNRPGLNLTTKKMAAAAASDPSMITAETIEIIFLFERLYSPRYSALSKAKIERLGLEAMPPLRAVLAKYLAERGRQEYSGSVR